MVQFNLIFTSVQQISVPLCFLLNCSENSAHSDRQIRKVLHILTAKNPQVVIKSH